MKCQSIIGILGFANELPVVHTDLHRFVDEIGFGPDTAVLKFDGDTNIASALPPRSRLDLLIVRSFHTQVCQEHLDGLLEPFTILNISAGDDHICRAVKNDPRVNLVSVGSAESVSEDAIAVAHLLLRRAFEDFENMRRGVFTNRNITQGLSGRVWTIFGNGRQAQHMVRRLNANNVAKIIVYSPNSSESKRDEIRAVVKGWESSELVFTDCIQTACYCEIASIHLPCSEDAYYGVVTHSLFDRELLSQFPQGVILVNMARGDLVNEYDAVSAIDSGKIGAMYADVLSKDAEDRNEPSLSPLWMSCKDNRFGSRLIVSSHKGNESDSMHRLSAETLRKELSKLFQETPSVQA